MNSTSDLTFLERRNYQKVAKNMLHSSDASMSFTDLMQRNTIELPPPVYALTAVSAIPLADAIREYHVQVGLMQPKLVIIQASKRLSRAPSVQRGDSIRLESSRIADVVQQQRVALVDQYVGTGRTIKYGREILLRAGAESVTTEHVRWFDQAVASDVDQEALTSNHSAFMRAIGTAAAQGSEFSFFESL